MKQLPAREEEQGKQGIATRRSKDTRTCNIHIKYTHARPHIRIHMHRRIYIHIHTQRQVQWRRKDSNAQPGAPNTLTPARTAAHAHAQQQREHRINVV